MDIAVAQAYAAFHRYRAPSSLDVCSCCVPKDIEKQLRTLTLKAIPAHHFHEYNASAKGPTQPVEEVAYFLPRMFELMAQGESIHHSTELYLDRLGRCPQDSWNAQELAAINAFALSFFDHVISASDGAEQPFDVLLMCHIGGIDVGPLLDHWRTSSDPMATVNFVIDTYWHFWEDESYSNAFATDRPDFRQTVHSWIFHPQTQMRFCEKLLAPDFLAVINGVTWGGHIPFSLMVEAAFEKLVILRG